MKISILGIIIDHYRTFYNFRSKRVSICDYVVQLGIPLAISMLLELIFDAKLSSGLINIIITSLSIFAALLLNLLILMYTVSRNLKDGEYKNTLFREITTNISYGILLSVILIVILISISIVFENDAWVFQNYFSLITRIVIWFGMIQFILTMLMILKRVYTVLNSD